ncbi:MAG: hypothetical protein NC094_02500 [Bacteroidales bacterium]|nr:hypothetical protein [Lachnoclostridium sp.]MCM1383421.1 hypothetical protein [Lachnoclostridium sp.]MCM1464268.1 hypothetical protein [Bacteroidales bacterium]
MIVTFILSLILMALFFLLLWAAVALVQSKKLFGTAPKDIQAAVLEHEERFPGARLLGWFLLVIDVPAFLSVFVYAGWDGMQRGYGFWQFTARFLIMLYLLKAFDIIFFDWFLLTKSHFFQHYYPETEGCAGYHQFGFNRKEQLMKLILFPFVALLLAWICTLF